MKTKMMICTLAAATLVVAAAACGKSKSSNGAPSFPEPPSAPTQLDRVGRPAIATVIHKVLDTSGATSEAFNGLNPSQDVSVGSGPLGDVVTLLHACPPAAIANALLPDVLTFNTTSDANYAVLNGRGLADDVIDDTLVALYSSAGGFCNGAGALLANGDNVTHNDVAFLTTFPFLAPPH